MAFKVLFVDDEKDMELLVRARHPKLLEEELVFIFARDGVEALEKLKEDDDIELVLSDLNMPRMDGLTLLEKINELPRPLQTIIITAYSDMENIRAAMNLNAFDFLVKPLDFEDLTITLKKALSHIRKTKENNRARQKAESALKEKDLYYRLIMKNALDGILTIDAECTILYVNHEIEKIFGYSKSELVGQNLSILIPEDFREAHQNGFKRYLESGKANISWNGVEQSGLHKSGKIIYLEITFDEFIENKQKIFVGHIRDNSERKQKDAERVRLMTAIEQTAEAVVITDTSGTIEYANPAFEKTSGYSRSEVLGKNPRILSSGIQDRAFYNEMWETIRKGKVWSGQLTNKTKSGDLIEEVLTISPIRDESGKIVNFVGVKKNVTHELELEKQLRQSQKMEAIGTLAGGIAHDFNNILFTMLGYMSMAKDELPKEDPIVEDLEEAIQAGNRAKKLIRQILSFSRQEESEFQQIELAPIVKEALKLLRSSIPTTIEIKHHIVDEEMPLLADPTQIHQVFVNLCTNAAHAMETAGGLLEIVLEKETIHSTFALQHSLKKGDYVKLTVRDSGDGIAAENQSKIFDPFFTTKSVDKGTGLGLSVVHGIVKNHGGSITFFSEAGKGTTFEVYLPIIDLKAETEETEEELDITGEGRILIVDDEIALVKLEKRILEHCGYEVVTAFGSLEALDLFQNQSESFDLVITDQTMPQMNGLELAKAIHQIRADLPIILITGYQVEQSEQKDKEHGIHKRLSKPLEIKHFSQSVKRVLQNSQQKNKVG
ncbi:MAG: PAS domain S-box protein [SAR324 cluster bacterium]|nr:PAS domain S-box protein [SAR324 cluster bacterium]